MQALKEPLDAAAPAEGEALPRADVPPHSRGLAVQHWPRYHGGYRAAPHRPEAVLASEVLA